MSKKSLNERIAELKPPGVDLNTKKREDPAPPKLNKSLTTLQVEATENQLKHLIGHMRMLNIKFLIGDTKDNPKNSL